jgi:hypothetical protein
LAYKQKQNFNMYNKNDIYALNVPGLWKTVSGTNGESFRSRFIEYFLSYKQQNQNSKFSQHLQESNHSVGPIEDVMEIALVVGKGHFMNVLEKFYI